MISEATQKAIIADALIKGERVTQIRALNMCGSIRLAAHIFTLKKIVGAKIISQRKMIRPGCYVAEYWITQPNRQRAKREFQASGIFEPKKRTTQ